MDPINIGLLTIWIFSVLKILFVPASKVKNEMALGWPLTMVLLLITMILCIVYLVVVYEPEKKPEASVTEVVNVQSPTEPLQTMRSSVGHSEQNSDSENDEKWSDAVSELMNSSLEVNFGDSEEDDLSEDEEIQDTIPEEEPLLLLQNLEDEPGWTPDPSFDASILALRKEQREFMSERKREMLDQVRRVLFPPLSSSSSEDDVDSGLDNSKNFEDSESQEDQQ